MPTKAISQLAQETGIHIPEILFPAKSIDLSRFATIACDQYTSDTAYWDEVYKSVGQTESSLHITLPEIYLKAPDLETRITKIKSTMSDYLKKGILTNLGPGFVYVERQTSAGLRQGLMLCLDLEAYDFSRDSKSLVRATEGTIVDRIPPRLKIRKGAPLEIPHIMVLIDDKSRSIIEGLAAKKDRFTALYDFDLMKSGGHIRGYHISDEKELSGILGQFEELKSKASEEQKTIHPILFAVGDGNHSLATAKTHWNEIKLTNPQSVARYALVELVNIHSEGLDFEPIYRAVFTKNPASFVDFVKSHNSVEAFEPCTETALSEVLMDPSRGQETIGFHLEGLFYKARVAQGTNLLPPALADLLHKDYSSKESEADIDYIHGWEDVKSLGLKNGVSIFVPVISREQLIPYVSANGPLPKKAFSMGEAHDKRYYLECRKIED